jgi:hypothetical protein
MGVKKRKTKGKTRPARIFVKGEKLYIQVGKKKILLKDAKNYRKSDIIDTLLEQLLIRRKRRKKGKITRRERRLNRDDLRIFNEFERMNKNQSKGSLKIPFGTSLGPKEALFYNAIMQFVKTLPKKDINVQVQEDIAKSKKESKAKEQSESKALVPVQKPQSIGTQISITDPNITVELERLRQEGELKDKTIEQQNKVGLILNDLNNFDKMGSKKKNKLILKKWQERFETDNNTKIDLGKNNKGRKNSWNSLTSKEYLEKIILAYGGFSNIDIIFKDYNQYRNELFDIPEEEKKTLQIEEKKSTSSEESDEDDEEDEDEDDEESDEEAEYKKFIKETDIAKKEEEKENPELSQAASAVLSQIASGNSYTGTGLHTDEIDDMMKPILGDMYLGALPSDFNKFLPKRLNEDKFGFIMNTDPSNKEGKHWVAILIDLDEDLSLEYFDSFGKDPDKKFMKEIKKLIDKIKPNSYLKFKINKVQVQDNKSQNCGFFAMKFLLDRLSNGMSFKHATGYKDEIVDDSIQGEHNIKSLKNKFGYI